MAGCLLHICSAKSKASSEELGGVGRNKLINTLEQRQIGPVTPWLLAPHTHQQLRHYTHTNTHTSPTTHRPEASPPCVTDNASRYNCY